jgi:hypothetical protein
MVEILVSLHGLVVLLSNSIKAGLRCVDSNRINCAYSSFISMIGSGHKYNWKSYPSLYAGPTGNRCILAIFRKRSELAKEIYATCAAISWDKFKPYVQLSSVALLWKEESSATPQINTAQVNVVNSCLS